MDGHISSGAFAAQVSGRDEPASTQFFTQPGRPYGHFSGLAHYIEAMMINGKTSYPVERTLLTTGALAAAFDSTYENGRRVQLGRRVVTPHLDIAYRAQKESLLNRGPLDPADPDFGIGP